MKLIIVRHGETEENVNMIIQGHLPGKLTEKGKLQAKNVGEKLKKEKINENALNSPTQSQQSCGVYGEFIASQSAFSRLQLGRCKTAGYVPKL